jgi:hypothetical protein
MRATAATLVLFCLSSAQAQDFSKPITYTTKAIPLHSVLQQIGEKSGVTLKSDQSLEEEPLILRLDKVPLKDVMDKIAEVFAADWVDHHDFWQLERSEKKIAQIRADLFEKRKESIHQSLDKLKAIQAQHPLDAKGIDDLVNGYRAIAKKEQGGETPDDQTLSLLQTIKPSTRLSAVILSQMDAAELASIPIGKRAVFSTRPNSLQKPLSEIPATAIKQYENEFHAIQAALEQVPNQERSMLGDLLSHPDGGIDRVVVSAAAETYQDDIKFNIQYLDKMGRVAVQDFQNLGYTTNDLNDSLRKFTALRKEAQKNGLPLDAVAMEIAPYTLRLPAGQTRPLSQAAQDFLLNPTANDPLSLATSQIILKTAEQDRLNAICLATDKAEFYALNAGRVGKTNLATFQVMAEGMCKMTINREDRWLVAKPTDPQYASEARLPRPALEKFIQSAFKRGYVGIDDGADLCSCVPAESDIQLARRYVSYLMPERYLDAMWDNPDLLRVLGSLFSDQRQQAAKQKLSLHVMDLNADQREALRRFIFDPYNSPPKIVQQPDGTGFVDGHDRTDFLPSGLSNDLLFEVSDVVEQTYYAQIEDGGAMTNMTIPLNGLVQMLAESSHPELYGAYATKIKRLSVGTRRNVTIRVRDGAKSMEDSVEERQKASDDMLTVDQFLASLPSDARQQIESGVNAEIERRRQFQSSHSAGTTPPQGAKPPFRT